MVYTDPAPARSLRRRRPPVLALAPLLLTLAGCGGGGNDETAPPVATQPELVDIRTDCPAPTVARFDIETIDRAPVVSLDDYLRARITWSAPSGAVVNDALGTRIRGRGNSTWQMPKKPYKLKTDAPVALLGLPAGRDWALLANYADKTLLRNALAFCIARTMALPFTPDSAMVEVSLNGQYEGLYQLTNKTYRLEARMADDANALTPVDPDAPFDDAFVLEIDFALRADHWFLSDSGIPWNFDTDTDADQRARIQAWINALEALIRNDEDPDRLTKVAERLDLQSLADYLLVMELTRNVDAYRASTFVHRLRGGRLTFGPVWDFDQMLAPYEHFEPERGTFIINETPEGWLFRERPHAWYARALLREPAFAALVQQRWARMAARVSAYQQYVRDAAQALDAAQQRNFARWPILNEPVFTSLTAHGSYAAEVAAMLDWLGQRAAWMNAHMAEIAHEP